MKNDVEKDPTIIDIPFLSSENKKKKKIKGINELIFN